MNWRALSPALLALFGFFAFFWNLGGYGIFDLDEGLYAESAREMRLTGDVVTPRVNGQPFFEKPPLLYWLSAASMMLFGHGEASVRLPAALATAALTALIVLFGARFYGRRAGLISGALFALSPLVFGAARHLTMDALLALCIAGALFSFFRAFAGTQPGDRLWNLGFWVCCALGTLAKGAPGIAIPLIVVLIFLINAEGGARAGLRRFASSISLAAGIPLFLFIVIPWHAAAWRASGAEFTNEYLIRQHLGRFRGGDTAHLAPFWFYAPGFLLGMFPWSLFVIPAFLDPCGRGNQPFACDAAGNRDPAAMLKRLLKIWFSIVFLLFSASGSKLISYILPLYPAAALLAGDWLSRRVEDPAARRAIVWYGGIAFCLAGLLLTAALFIDPILKLVEETSRRPIPREAITPSLIGFARNLLLAAAVGTGLFTLLARLNRPRAGLQYLLAGMAAFMAVAVLQGLPAVDSAFLRPLHRLAAQAGTIAGEESGPLVVDFVDAPRRPSVFFYLPDRLPGAVIEMKEADSVAQVARSRRPSVVLCAARRAPFWREQGFREIQAAGSHTLLARK